LPSRDFIISAIGYTTDKTLFKNIYPQVDEVCSIGDYKKTRKIFNAIVEAKDVAKDI